MMGSKAFLTLYILSKVLHHPYKDVGLSEVCTMSKMLYSPSYFEAKVTLLGEESASSFFLNNFLMMMMMIYHLSIYV